MSHHFMIIPDPQGHNINSSSPLAPRLAYSDLVRPSFTGRAVLLLSKLSFEAKLRLSGRTGVYGIIFMLGAEIGAVW